MVDAKIGSHPLKIGEMCVDPRNGKRAGTAFEVLEQYSDWCLISCLPQMERAHQIRVHLKHAGHVIVGDELYGGKKLWLSRMKRDYRLKPGREERPLISRVALHSCELTLPHPVTLEPVTIRSEVPKDLRVALKYLRLYATGRGGLPDRAEF